MRYARNSVVLHEPFEEEWFSALLFGGTKGSLFLDVGAAAGYYCLLGLRLRPRMAVVAVNPSAYFQRVLVANAALQHVPVEQAAADDVAAGRPLAQVPSAGHVLQLPVAVSAQPGRSAIGSLYGSSIRQASPIGGRQGSAPRRDSLRRSGDATSAAPAEHPVVTLRDLLTACCNHTRSRVHLMMMDVQGEESGIFATPDTQAVLESHALERIIVGIHYGQGTATRVSNALRRAGYSILLEAASVPAQPDGVVIAVAPHVEAPLSLLALAGRSHKSAKDAEPPTPG